MENNYNLDDVSDSFEFTLGGHKYKMRYPNTEDIENGDKLKTDAEKMDWLYGFITSTTPEAPSIKDALKRVHVKVMAEFNKMIATEFGG